jgi:hypothetical protein
VRQGGRKKVGRVSHNRRGGMHVRAASVLMAKALFMRTDHSLEAISGRGSGTPLMRAFVGLEVQSGGTCISPSNPVPR